MNTIKIIDDFLSNEECNSLLEKCKKELTLTEGTTWNKSQENGTQSRKSSVGWIRDLGFLNERLTKILKESFNINGMEVTGLGEFQFTEYKVSEYFDWHTDSTDMIYRERFASIVIQLNNEYTGGILQIKNTKGEDVPFDNKIGTLYVFNSRLFHRVTPIETGTRYSLVNWISLIKTDSKKQNLI